MNMFIIKKKPLEASFYGFYKDKHRIFLCNSDGNSPSIELN